MTLKSRLYTKYIWKCEIINFFYITQDISQFLARFFQHINLVMYLLGIGKQIWIAKKIDVSFNHFMLSEQTT